MAALPLVAALARVFFSPRTALSALSDGEYSTVKSSIRKWPFAV
jgi:hypothetical protein